MRMMGNMRTVKAHVLRFQRGTKTPSRTKMGRIFEIPLSRIWLQFVLKIWVFKVIWFVCRVNLITEDYSGCCWGSSNNLHWQQHYFREVTAMQDGSRKVFPLGQHTEGDTTVAKWYQAISVTGSREWQNQCHRHSTEV